MALDVYFQKEIARVLTAIATAQLGTVPASVLDVDDPAERARLVQVVQAERVRLLVSVALAFGIDPCELSPVLDGKWRRQMVAGARMLPD